MPEIELNTGDRIPHACLICAPSAESALQKAKELAAAAVCSGAGKKPCGICRDCRKVEAGVHPDVICVSRLTDDKGKQKTAITVDQIPPCPPTPSCCRTRPRARSTFSTRPRP